MSVISKLLAARYASRSISGSPVPAAVMIELIEAVRLTPSCYNNQPWHWLFLTSPEALEKGRECLAKPNLAWAGRAPLLAVLWARKKDDCLLKDGRAYYAFDCGMSAMDLMLAATANDLIARPMAGYDPAKAAELFKLDEDAEVLLFMAIGYHEPDESHLPERLVGLGDKPRERKAADAVVTIL
jgi:nitroreductase